MRYILTDILWYYINIVGIIEKNNKRKHIERLNHCYMCKQMVLKLSRVHKVAVLPVQCFSMPF